MGRLISSEELDAIIDGTQSGLLLEPPYRRKYMPLGLAKIAGALRDRGVPYDFVRQVPVGSRHDVIYVATLFTFHSAVVLTSIAAAAERNPGAPIVVGGVLASLRPRWICDHTDDRVKVFAGYSKRLDATRPDYQLDYGVDPPWNQAALVFTQRGCPNRCAYCAVPRIEPEQWVCPTWREQLDSGRRWVLVSDNNLTAHPAHLMEVAQHAVRRSLHVTLDNGLDCKGIDADTAAVLGRVHYVRSGCRLAFDRIEEDGAFQHSVLALRRAGVPAGQLLAYVLFNFTDAPAEAHYRARECVRAGVRPYPQQYEPLGELDRTHTFIGHRWTPQLVRAFRTYWLMAGYFTRVSFETWARSPLCPVQLGTEDWRAFEADDGGWLERARRHDPLGTIAGGSIRARVRRRTTLFG